MSGWDLNAPDGATLLDDVEGFLSRFVVYRDENQRVAHVLWIAHCWFMDQWESTPRIAFLSPEPGSGKSRALEVSDPLVPRAVHAVNATSAALFRKVSDPDGLPTILFDEIDTIFGPKAKENEDLRGLLNAGHRRGATALRCVIRGKTVGLEELPAYCAVALAGLDDLPDTIMTRSVVVRMRRRAHGERIEPWRQRINAPQAQEVAARLSEWSVSNQETVTLTWPPMPEGVEDRDADVWEPLLAVADLAHGRWPERARRSAVALVAEKSQRAPSIGVMLLQDLRDIFRTANADKMPTDDVLEALIEMVESPWGDIRGKELDARSLARRLSKYGIKPKNIRIDERVVKGYDSGDLVDAWDRYLPVATDALLQSSRGYEGEVQADHASGDSSATTATPLQPPPDDLTQMPGRCNECAFHIETQGHRASCSQAVAS